jgi:hypothetical protein
MRHRSQGSRKGLPCFQCSQTVCPCHSICVLSPCESPRLPSRLCLAALGEPPGDPIPGGLGLRGLIPLLRRLEDGWTVGMLSLPHLNRHAQGQEHFTELGTSSRFGQGAYDI